MYLSDRLDQRLSSKQNIHTMRNKFRATRNNRDWLERMGCQLKKDAVVRFLFMSESSLQLSSLDISRKKSYQITHINSKCNI